jgi:hypothetical protein
MLVLLFFVVSIVPAIRLCLVIVRLWEKYQRDAGEPESTEPYLWTTLS